MAMSPLTWWWNGTILPKFLATELPAHYRYRPRVSETVGSSCGTLRSEVGGPGCGHPRPSLRGSRLVIVIDTKDLPVRTHQGDRVRSIEPGSGSEDLLEILWA
jgi:hypothetical protein